MEKKKGFGYDLIGSYWYGEAVGGLTEGRASYVIG